MNPWPSAWKHSIGYALHPSAELFTEFLQDIDTLLMGALKLSQRV